MTERVAAAVGERTGGRSERREGSDGVGSGAVYAERFHAAIGGSVWICGPGSVAVGTESGSTACDLESMEGIAARRFGESSRRNGMEL